MQEYSPLHQLWSQWSRVISGSHWKKKKQSTVRVQLRHQKCSYSILKFSVSVPSDECTTPSAQWQSSSGPLAPLSLCKHRCKGGRTKNRKFVFQLKCVLWWKKIKSRFVHCSRDGQIALQQRNVSLTRATLAWMDTLCARPKMDTSGKSLWVFSKHP